MARQYDVVLLGATGYTGKLCAEHIANHLPTNLKWAVAGRNASKLQELVDTIQTLNRDRLEPEVLTVGLNSVELDVLARRTKVLINTVGPYHLYSTPVVGACAKNGTHYLDVYEYTCILAEALVIAPLTVTGQAKPPGSRMLCRSSMR